MDAVCWLALANMAVWLGLGSYVAFLAFSQRRLKTRIAQMENLANDR